MILIQLNYLLFSINNSIYSILPEISGIHNFQLIFSNYFKLFAKTISKYDKIGPIRFLSRFQIIGLVKQLIGDKCFCDKIVSIMWHSKLIAWSYWTMQFLLKSFKTSFLVIKKYVPTIDNQQGLEAFMARGRFLVIFSKIWAGKPFLGRRFKPQS